MISTEFELTRQIYQNKLDTNNWMENDPSTTSNKEIEEDFLRKVYTFDLGSSEKANACFADFAYEISFQRKKVKDRRLREMLECLSEWEEQKKNSALGTLENGEVVTINDITSFALAMENVESIKHWLNDLRSKENSPWSKLNDDTICNMFEKFKNTLNINNAGIWNLESQKLKETIDLTLTQLQKEIGQIEEELKQERMSFHIGLHFPGKGLLKLNSTKEKLSFLNTKRYGNEEDWMKWRKETRNALGLDERFGNANLKKLFQDYIDDDIKEMKEKNIHNYKWYEGSFVSHNDGKWKEEIRQYWFSHEPPRGITITNDEWFYEEN